MKKIFSIVILLLFFPFKSFAAIDGKGQIQLSENVINSFIRYITGDTTENNKIKQTGRMVSLNQQLTILGEEPMKWLVRDGNGNEGMLPIERVTNYVRVDNTLIPKNNVEWL